MRNMQMKMYSIRKGGREGGREGQERICREAEGMHELLPGFVRDRCSQQKRDKED